MLKRASRDTWQRLFYPKPDHYKILRHVKYADFLRHKTLIFLCFQIGLQETYYQYVHRVMSGAVNC